jgi:hypothetical protein
MKIYLFLLLLPVITSAFAATSQENCTPIDLRNDTLAEVRNQQDVSWCYAFTGADMLGHAFNVSEKISAADIAIGYNETRVGLFVRWLDLNLLKRKNPLTRLMPHQNGFNKVSLINAMKDGMCPERIFPSESWTKVTRTENGETQTQVPLAQAMLEISALHDIKNSLTSENIPFYYSFKNIDAAGFVQLLQNKKIEKFYSSLREAVCRDDRRPFEYNWKVRMVFKNPRIFSRISEQLEMGRLVGLDYDSRILKDASNRGFKLSELHTSPLVGRRWNNSEKTCEYLVRNSYGEDCSVRYDQSYDCESGNVWLSESKIYTSMTSIVYMQN